MPLVAGVVNKGPKKKPGRKPNANKKEGNEEDEETEDDEERTDAKPLVPFEQTPDGKNMERELRRLKREEKEQLERDERVRSQGGAYVGKKRGRKSNKERKEQAEGSKSPTTKVNMDEDSDEQAEEGGNDDDGAVQFPAVVTNDAANDAASTPS